MRPRPRPPARPGIPHHTHRPLRRLVRAASWHRRKLAVVAAALTVVTGLAATAPPAPPTSTVVRTRTALGGGTLLTADDLEVVALPGEGLPERAAGALDELVGRRLAAPVARHQVLTPLTLASAQVVAVGHVLAPVRLADADVVALLRPGDVVDVIGVAAEGGRASTVAHAVRVVTIPVRSADDQATSAGALVVLDVPDTAAGALTRAAADGSLTIIWT